LPPNLDPADHRAGKASSRDGKQFITAFHFFSPVREEMHVVEASFKVPKQRDTCGCQLRYGLMLRQIRKTAHMWPYN